MTKLLFHEFQKVFIRKEFFIAITFAVILSVLGLIEQCLKSFGSVSFTVHSAWQQAMVFQGATGQAIIYCLLPIIPCIACADTYYVEKSSGVIIFILSRCERVKYLISKSIVIVIVSFLISILPFILNQLLCLAAFPLQSPTMFTNWPSYQDINIVYGDIAVFPNLYINYPYLNNLLHITLIGLFGAVIGLFS